MLRKAIVLLFLHCHFAFRTPGPHIFVSRTNDWKKQSALYLFGFFNRPQSNEKPAAVAAPVDKAKVEKLKSGLEKISYTQNRDYEMEAKLRAPPPPVIQDQQIKSFNFNKENEFPNLYKGWIRSDGDQIGKQIIASTKLALQKKDIKYLEVLFDPVPNLDEVAFGTEWNKKLRKDVTENLRVPDYATNRGGPSTLEWSNIYWANRLAEGLRAQIKGDIVLISLSGEGLKAPNTPTLTKGTRLVSLSTIKKMPLVPGEIGLFILLSPCSESHYRDGIQLADKSQVPIIALNAPFSYRYDIGGGKPFELTYVMKRIPKGWYYRQYPKDFEIIIEGPNYEILKAKSYSSQIPLTEISKVSMQASAEKYGSVGNDRIFQNRL